MLNNNKVLRMNTLAALLGSTSAFSTALGPIDCIFRESNTYILGTDTTDDLTDHFIPDFTKGICCDAFGDDQLAGGSDGKCNVRCDGNNNAFCIGQSDGINSRLLINFLIPSDADNCPTDGNILSINKSDVPIETTWNFPGVVPNDLAKDWHCKWKISANATLLPRGTKGLIEEREANGWLVVEGVSTGFDRDVIVTMQPQDKFYDFNYRDRTNNALE